MLYRQWFRQLRVEGRSGKCTCSLNKPREEVAQSPAVLFHGGVKMCAFWELGSMRSF